MSNTLCPLPWMHLATHPEGKVTLCCISDHTRNMSAARTNGKVLNLNNNSVNEIVNSDYFKQVRLEMLAGGKPEACSRCYREEIESGHSKRLLEKSKFPVVPLVNLSGEITPNLRFIELRLGNLCNVKCRTCNPASSTQWITEYKKLESELRFVTNYSNAVVDSSWTESDIFWDQLLDASRDVELIYINGGEPTLVKKHWNYLQRLIDKGLHNQVTLWYNINMTSVPDELLTIWKNFKKVIVHGSVDDIGERNSYIRKGTRWIDVEENIKKLKDNQWIDFQITQTVSWLNVYYVKEFIEYFNVLNINTHFNIVNDPVFLSPRILPNNVKQILKEKLSTVPNSHVLLNNISSGEDIDLMNKGIIYNKWLDKYRQEDFSKAFSEWAKIIGYNNE